MRVGDLPERVHANDVRSLNRGQFQFSGEESLCHTSLHADLYTKPVSTVNRVHALRRDHVLGRCHESALIMKRTPARYWLAITVLILSGCASLGYFDNSEFIAALSANPKQCRAAYQMLAKPFTGRTDEMTHHGIWELNCGDREKGRDYLSRAAMEGDGYAKRTLVHYGLPLPDPEIQIRGGGVPAIDVYIHK